MVIRLLKDRLEPLRGAHAELRPLRVEDAERYGEAKEGSAWGTLSLSKREAFLELVEDAVLDRSRYDFLLVSLPGGPVGEAALEGIDWEMESGRVSVRLFDRTASAAEREGLGLLLEFAFGRLCLHRLEAETPSGDRRGQEVLERAGFRREGLRREALWQGEGYCDAVLYAMLERDYPG